jgi:acetate kinase
VAGCRWLGAEIDAGRNAAGACDLTGASSRVKIMMIPTDEELNIAKSTVALAAKRAGAADVRASPVV